MQTKICPQCETENFAINRVCKNCQYTFSAAAVHRTDGPAASTPPAPETPPIEMQSAPLHFVEPQRVIIHEPPRRRTSSEIVSCILWVLLFLFIAVVYLDYASASRLDTTAPQQGARAAMSCFYVIAGYCAVRALTEAIRLEKGK